MDERKKMSSGEIKWKWRISPVTGDLWGIKLIKWLGSESQVKDLECPKTTGFGVEWVLELNYHPCWDRKMSLCWCLRPPELINMMICWLICDHLDFPVIGVMGVFLWIWWWLKRLANLGHFFFFSLQHFLPCFLEYIEHCFSGTEAITKDEAVAILAKLILVKAEPPTIGSMAFEKYPLVFTEASVRWDFSSLANTRCVCVALGLRAVQNTQKLPTSICWSSCAAGRFANQVIQ